MDIENSSTDGADGDAYACDKCERKFKGHAALVQHRCVRKKYTRLHQGPAAQRVTKIAMLQWPYRCHVCGHRYTNGREMMAHMKQQHWLKSGREPCVCRTCLKAGWIRVPLGELQRRAQLTEEQPDESPPRAEDSDEVSSSRTDDSAEASTEGPGELPRKAPSVVKRRQCPVCGRLLACKANMIVHVRSHTGERPFRCKTCDKRYASRSGLRRHEIIKHASPKCVLSPARRAAVPRETPPAAESVEASADCDDDRPVASVLAEDETLVRVMLKNQQVSSVPARKEPVIVVSEDEGHRETKVVMAVVPDTSFRALVDDDGHGRSAAAAVGRYPKDSASDDGAGVATNVVEWPELMERTREYVETTGELNEFLEQVCRDEPPPPDELVPTLPCVLDASREMQLRKELAEITDPLTGAKSYRCHVCCKNLKQYITWCRHLTQHGHEASGQPEARYTCNSCSVTMRTREDFREHKRTVHMHKQPRRTQKNTTVCPLCRSVLYDKFSLIRHTRLKHGFANAPCYGCSIPSAYASEFSAYLDVHSSACKKARVSSGPSPRTAG